MSGGATVCLNEQTKKTIKNDPNFKIKASGMI